MVRGLLAPTLGSEFAFARLLSGGFGSGRLGHDTGLSLRSNRRGGQHNLTTDVPHPRSQSHKRAAPRLPLAVAAVMSAIGT